VMYAGRVVETARTTELFERPTHPYTEGLLAAVPRVDTPRSRLHAIPGQVPAATAWPAGCRFHPRCPYAWEKCAAEEPPLLDAGGQTGEDGGDGGEVGHTARCWLVTEPERRERKR
jgi:oligopeptide/dipeptide ABC transporter ATP-binding protein